MKKHTLASVIATSFTFLGLFILLTSVTLASWRSPTQGPTNGNPAIPINMGSSEQTKTGRLTVNQFVVNSGMLVSGKVGIDPTSTNEKLNVGGRVDSTGYCINGNCVTSWSGPGGPGGGSSGTVTQINQGTGITLSPNPITDTGTISVNTNAIQTRVSGSCSSGSAIRLIRANGTVICESTSGGGSGGSYTAGNGLQLSGSTFSIDSPACGSNQHSRWTGSSWVCNTDQTGGGGGGGGVSGSGTSGYVPRWTGSSSLGNSVIRDNGTNVGIGRSPYWSAKLIVQGGSSNGGIITATRPGGGSGSGVWEVRNDYTTQWIDHYMNGYDIHMGWESKESGNVIYRGTSGGTAFAYCSAGKRVISGGCTFGFTDGRGTTSRPSGNNAWECQVTNGDSVGSALLKAHAICANIR